MYNSTQIFQYNLMFYLFRYLFPTYCGSIEEVESTPPVKPFTIQSIIN